MSAAPRDCLAPPPDGTPDREQYDRFADFLRMTAATDPVGITEETYRYLLGEDVAPVAVDADHPAAYSFRPMKARR